MCERECCKSNAKKRKTSAWKAHGRFVMSFRLREANTHRQQRDALKTFLISCTFASLRRYNFWFIFLLFWILFGKLFVWQSEFLSWFHISNVDLRLDVQLATTIKLSVCTLMMSVSAWPLTSFATQCSKEQFHLVFNYIISLLHIYWTIHPLKKSWKVSSIRSQTNCTWMSITIKCEKFQFVIFTWDNKFASRVQREETTTTKVSNNRHLVLEWMNE